MTRTLKKHALSWLMALALLVSVDISFEIFGYKAYAYTIPPAATTVSEIQGRLKAIADKWHGKTQMDMKNAGASPYGWPDGGNCTSFAKTVFEQVFGLMAPGGYEGYIINGSYSDNVTPIVQQKSGNTVSIAKSAFKKAKVGDIVQCKRDSTQHTMVIYSVSDEYITVLDCNAQYYNGQWGEKDVIRLRNEYYDFFVNHSSGFTIYRAVNYPADEPETPPRISVPTTKAEVESRINSIINGQYGNGKTFPYSSTPVPISLAGEAGGTGTFGYARYVFYQVFGISMSPGVAQNEWQLSNSNGNLETVASCGGTSDASTMKADIFKTKPGDVIQGKGSGFYQTMIVLSYDENSITILDCDNDYKCGIAVRTRDWAKFSSAFKQYTIYRSKNYPVSESLKQITVNITKPAGIGSLDTTIKYVEVCGSGIHTLLSISDNGTMALTGIPDGKYTFTFSANNCAPNRYGVDIKNGTVKGLENGVELHLIGDIDGNGKVNTLDVAKANAHAKNRILLSGYDLTVSDIDSNGKVNTLDVAKINAHAKNKIGLW